MKTSILLPALACWLLLATAAPADNLDPDNSDQQFAWSESAGWLNFQPPDAGALVATTALIGYVWAENIGWINLSPQSFGGVTNDSQGNLAGFAWAQNAGWINFNPQPPQPCPQCGVRIDPAGHFTGYAYAENLGWINFNGADLFSRNVRVCITDLEDLALLTSNWLTPSNAAALAPPLDQTDLKDYAALAQTWLSYCPNNWPTP